MASIEIGNYIIDHNLKTGRFDLYKKGDKEKIASYSTPTACKELVLALNKNEKAHFYFLHISHILYES